MLQNRPHLRTIALSAALSALLSTAVAASGAEAKDSSCAKASNKVKLESCKRAKEDDKSTAGGSLSYLNALGKKSGHYGNGNCNKSGAGGYSAVSDKFSTSSGGLGYKLATGNGKGTNSKAASNSKKDSSSNSGSGNIPGLGKILKGKFDNGSNSKNSSENSGANSGSGSGSGSFGFGFGLGSLFGGGSNSNTNANANSNSTSNSQGAASSTGFGLGSLFGSNSGSNSNSNSSTVAGSTSGSNSTSGSTSGTGTGMGLLPLPGTNTNSNSSSNNPVNLPNILKPVKPIPVKQADLPILTDEYVRGQQLHLDEYQKRLQRWAATGQTVTTPGNAGTPDPQVRPRPIFVSGTAGESDTGSGSSSGGGGGGSSAGAGQGFSPNTSGLFMQQAWNAMNSKSAQNDASQQRQPDPSNPNDYYMSLPSADRTMRQMFVEQVAGQDQNKKNCPGGECDSKGQQGNFDQLKPQEPPQEVTSRGNALAAEFEEQVEQQVGNSPQSAADKAKTGMQSQAQGAGEAGAAGSVEGIEQALMVMFLPTSTINVANEATGTPGSTLTPFRPLTQAIWMVQKMFKQVYIPMAILLLLPGALVLNIKVMVQAGINKGGDEDTTSPFSAIMRSIIAVFLIPATQLIVSYASDIGSSMTHEVAGATKVMALVAWAKTAMGESMTPLNGEATGTSNMQAGKAMFKAVMNTVSMTLAYGLLMLIAFQITIMCYLMCMGPIAAAFYVWPTGVGRLFKPVFANWVDAVINIALWKFWWCVIVLCMLTRINVMTFVDINPEWEAYMFVCFLVMMSYVPFCPFECKPGEMVDKILQKAQELKKSAQE